MKTHEKLGPIGRQLCYNWDGWIVGGAVDYICGITNQPPKDIDIIISPFLWRHASLSFPSNSTLNRFGGVKFNDSGIIIDCWPDEVGQLFARMPDSEVYSPKYSIKLRKILNLS